MTAKDLRKSWCVRVPPALRPCFRAERQKGRSNSAAGALRRIVERQIAHGYQDHGIAPEAARPPYRVQLSRKTRELVIGLAHQFGVSVEYVLIQLLAAEARGGEAAHPSLQDLSRVDHSPIPNRR